MSRVFEPIMLENGEILFCGDPHNEFGRINYIARARHPAAIILLGDYDLQKPLHVELAEARQYTGIYWIAGNHDFDREEHYDSLFVSTS